LFTTLLAICGVLEKASMAVAPLQLQADNKYMTNMLSCVLLVLILLLPNIVAPQTVIKNLPGYSGDLPFKLETG
jgi:hypothetical protein